jgi:phosphate butyryltransferase
MIFKQLSEILEIARKQRSRKMAVAAAEDRYVLKAVMQAQAENIIEPILIGDSDKIIRTASEIELDLENIPLIHETDPVRTCQIAVDLVRRNEAEILMKGLVSTAPLLKAVLNKQKGLRKRELLSHAALFEVPGYPKLVTVTDAAINVEPGLKEKVHIIENAVEIYHRLGIKEPKVAALGPVETINSKIQSTVDAGELKQMNLAGTISGCLVDGPLAMDVAVSKEAAEHKKIKGPVAGDADVLLVPDLDSGNILYKALVFLANSISAAVVMGARVPIVLTSRADPERSKLMSIALAAALD